MNAPTELAKVIPFATTQQLAAVHPDPQIARKLPYHFAKAKGIIAVRVINDVVELWVRPNLEASALAEVRRILRGEAKHGTVPPLWDGRAAERMADILNHQQRTTAN